jgi:hypothetical protein
MKQRRSSITCTTAEVPPTAGQLVTSERGVCGGPLAFHYANLMSHTAFRQSLACVGVLYQLQACTHMCLNSSSSSSSGGSPSYACSPVYSGLSR